VASGVAQTTPSMPGVALLDRLQLPDDVLRPPRNPPAVTAFSIVLLIDRASDQFKALSTVATDNHAGGRGACARGW
jgi:hypothetical protein